MVTFLISGWTEQQTLDTINSYCDIDGRIKQQKTRKAGGDWARCQNNYECDSNICSSGECIEIANAIREASVLKAFFVKFGCRFMNPISDEEYNQCVFNYLGETSNELVEIPPASGPSSGGSGGSSA